MDDKIKQSLRYSLWDGIFASVMMGIGDNFITPYALALGATASLIGVLASSPYLVTALLQLNAAALVDRIGSRKPVITSAVFAQALMWLPIIAIPYLVSTHRAVYLIIIYTLFVAIGTLAAPPWSSLMADHVPETIRGKVFGWRNRLFGVVNVSSMLLAGLALSGFGLLGRYFPELPAASLKLIGFTAVFSVAFVARLVSWYFLTRMYEPKLVIKPEHRFTFIDFIKRMRRTNFGKFVIFVASMNFSVFVGAPFLAVYMLRDLKFDYLTYTVITLTATLTMVLTMNHWGSHADQAGNRRVLRLSSLFLPVIPFLWLFSHQIWYLICVQLFAGFFWAGFNLSFTNFMYDAVTPEKRTRCIAYFNAINSMAVCLGALAGGLLVKIAPPVFGYSTLTLIFLSGVLRFLSAGLCAFVAEVREVKKISNKELFYSIIGLRPIFSASAAKEYGP